MSLKNLIQFNDDFKYSVNIEYDYDDANKINSYILTRDNVEALKFYFNNLTENKYRANFLIGAYGKGKSNLLLVLLNLLTAYGKEHDKNVSKFIEKIKPYDKELYGQIKEFRKSNKRFLPVIINSNYDDLNRSFLYAIKRAIEKFHFSDITFDSYYDVAYKTIEKWEKDNKVAYKLLLECIDKTNKKITLKELKDGLKNFDNDIYKIFLDIYTCVTNGEKFEPLINTDIVKIYKEVLHQIRIKNNEFVGLYIVFDEFSKFLEQSKDENIIRDITFLQNLAEAISRSDNEEQIHLTCITHKPIIEYLKIFGEDRINAFKTIEGRFKNIYLNKNLLDSYEMISHSYKIKDEKYVSDKLKEDNIKGIYDYCKKDIVFNKINNFDELIKKGCYPLNPYTLYSLINLIEYVGQNERSIFNFITADDPFSLKDYATKKYDEKYDLYPLDFLYDYFVNLIKADRNAKTIDIYGKIESSLISIENNEEISNEQKEKEKRIVKSLGLIYLCREIDYFKPTKETIQYSLNISKKNEKELKEFDNAFLNLTDSGLIRKVPLSENIQFSDKTASLLISKANELAEKNTDFEVDAFLNKELDSEYELPRRYNDENYINRFFRHIYITKEKLLQLNSFDVFFKERFQDGLVVNIILLKKMDEREIKQYLSGIKENRVVFVIPNAIIDSELVNLCKLYKSYEQLLSEKNSNKEEQIFIKKDREEIKEIINDRISLYFSQDNYKKVIYNGKEISEGVSLNSVVSEACKNSFKNTPILNYELINKNQINSGNQKNVGFVSDFIIENGLSEKNITESITSAENSIYRVFKYYIETNDNKNKKTNEIIKEFFSNCENNKQEFKTLFDKLKRNYIYLRNGVLPLYLAYNLGKYKGNIVLYYKNQEIELNTDNIYKAIANEGDYSISIIKKSTQKNDYLNKLLIMFDLKSTNNTVADTKMLIGKMKKYFMSLPNISRSVNYNNRMIDISDNEIEFKNCIIKEDLNSVDFVYERVFEIFNIKRDYDKALDKISETKKIYDNYYKNCIEAMSNNIKEIFGFKTKSGLKASFDSFVSDNKEKIAVNIYKNKTKDFVNFIMNNNNYDEEYILNKLANVYLSMNISDFRGSEIEKFFKGIVDSIEEIKDSEDTKGNKEIVRISIGTDTFEKGIKKDISKLGETLKNILTESIDEYGSSISNQEKVYILLKMIEDLV